MTDSEWKESIEHALPGWLVERAREHGYIAAISYLKQCHNNLEEENRKLKIVISACLSEETTTND